MSVTEILPPPQKKSHLWVKGQPSPNPLGPRANIEYRAMQDAARRHSVTSIAVLADLQVHAKSEAVRAMCANMLLDRAFGKPKQTVDVEQQGRTLEDILTAIAAARQAQREAELASENP